MKMKVREFDKDKWLSRLVWPKKNSHKGENGRVLVIGGSSLFHAAPFWAANAASRMVDMVHFSSPYLLNNELVEKKVKEGFWNGIVVPWEEVERYIEEDDVVLIGPGMLRQKVEQSLSSNPLPLALDGVEQDDTKGIVGYLLKKYPEKKWVVDGGALQEVELEWLSEKMIVTPNQKELSVLFDKLKTQNSKVKTTTQSSKLFRLEMVMRIVERTGVTMMVKGPVDLVVSHNIKEDFFDIMRVEGGDAGMTKGGTGDVLAGIVAGLYAKNEAMVAAVVGSYLNKKIGEKLAREQVWFNASDMVEWVDKV